MKEELFPAFSKNNVAVFCSTDRGYIPYCYVMLQSLIEHTTKAWNYDLIILEEQLTPDDKAAFAGLANGRENISVRFFNVSSHMSGRSFNIGGDLTLATWYRIFAPSIFQHYERIVYLDVDIIVLSDIERLYNVEMGENWLAGYTDLDQVSEISHNGEKSSSAAYYREIVGVTGTHKYVNAGVLVFNIQQMIRHNVESKCINAAQKFHFGHHDQDTLNHVCFEHVKFLDSTWNVFPARGFEKYLPSNDYQMWQLAKQAPNIIHYILDKPWQSPLSDMASYWWKYAALTPYYHTLREKHLSSFFNDVLHLSSLKREYWYYRLLSHISFGKRHAVYNERKRAIRKRMQRVCILMTMAKNQ